MQNSLELSVELPDDIKKRLEELAEKTGRSVEYYAVKALERYLDARAFPEEHDLDILPE